MRIEAAQLAGAIAIGVGATLAMDAWNLALRRTSGIRSLDFCLLGRWLRHMPAAFRHASIASAPARPAECAVGWLAHYCIGISLAVGLVLGTSGEWLERPTLPVALLYGLATAAFPLFVLQPALGLGIASSRSPRPMAARTKSLLTHAVYGLALYLCAQALHSAHGVLTLLRP